MGKIAIRIELPTSIFGNPKEENFTVNVNCDKEDIREALEGISDTILDTAAKVEGINEKLDELRSIKTELKDLRDLAGIKVEPEFEEVPLEKLAKSYPKMSETELNESIELAVEKERARRNKVK